jgi:hypothetical protein
MAEQFVYSQKNNFSGGELTPTIEGRTELGLYQNGIKKLINFMLLPSGGIMRRHGTKFVHLFRKNVPKKMVSVMFSRKLSYLLVFESHKLRTTCSFFVDGELFLTTKTVKDGGNSGNDFHFHPKEFSCVTFQGIAYISFGASRPIFKFSVDPEVVEQFHAYLKEKSAELQADSSNRPEIAASLALESAADFPDKDRMFIIEPLKCHVNYFRQTGSVTTLKPSIKPFNEVIYNADIDRINDELKAIHGLGSQNIFEAKEEQLYCTSVVAFENRLWCFGAGRNIHSIWASYKGDFSDFRMAYKTLLEARNPLTAFSATFSSSTFDNVLWQVPFASELLLGTTDGIYLVKEGDRSKGEFIRIHREIELPVSPIKPVVLGKTIFFVEGNNRKINSLFYSQEKGGFQIADITAYSEHIFADGIRQITGSNSPFSIIFAVLKNGSFATFTYSQDLKIMGWSQHRLGGNGEVLEITPVYADSEDRLYFHVRRPDDTGVESKEYLEVLLTRYFSAKSFETQKPVYADCHINTGRPGEQAIARSIEAAIRNDTAHEFRGSITKLEHIIQSQAENISKLDLDNMDLNDIKQAFRYKGKLLGEFEANIAEIEEFLRRYYRDYQPVILELLGLCFAFHRLFGRIYANLENLFCGEAEQMAQVESLLDDGERLGGDIIHIIEHRVTDWEVPPVLRGDSSGNLIEYIPCGSFSFHPAICLRVKTFNTQMIKQLVDLTKTIVTSTKDVFSKQSQLARELHEMRLAVAQLNKRILQYYSDYDRDNRKELLVNIKKFFEEQSIDFYTELLNIAHPTLTQCLFSSEVREFIESEIANFHQNTTRAEIEDKAGKITASLVKKLEQRYIERKTDEITSMKRRQEIAELLRSIIAEQNLNQSNKDYLLSAKFAGLIDGVIDEHEFQAVTSDEESAAGIQGQSQSDDEESPAQVTNHRMQTLQIILSHFKSGLIDYCGLIMPGTHQSLLKNILEDERSIRLEKYLLLSKKYFPVFKKMFPDIGAYELSVIAGNCLPSFDRLKLDGILPIFRKMTTAIIGDEELHDTKILSEEIITLKHPVRHLSIGFPYKSIMQTFPFIFPDEVEHCPKMDVEIGLKLFNTKGGYLEEQTDNGSVKHHHIKSRTVSSDDLIRFTSQKKYLAAKEVSDVLASPYHSGWKHFILGSKIQTDIDCTFITNKPHPASILKIYAKAKILPNYKGLA